MHLFQHLNDTADEWSWSLTVYNVNGRPTFPEFLVGKVKTIV